VERTGLRLVDDREQVAADSRSTECSTRPITALVAIAAFDRVAAALEDPDARLRGQRLAGGDDAVFRSDSRSTRR